MAVTVKDFDGIPLNIIDPIKGHSVWKSFTDLKARVVYDNAWSSACRGIILFNYGERDYPALNHPHLTTAIKNGFMVVLFKFPMDNFEMGTVTSEVVGTYLSPYQSFFTSSYIDWIYNGLRRDVTISKYYTLNTRIVLLGSPELGSICHLAYLLSAKHPNQGGHMAKVACTIVTSPVLASINRGVPASITNIGIVRDLIQLEDYLQEPIFIMAPIADDIAAPRWMMEYIYQLSPKDSNISIEVIGDHSSYNMDWWWVKSGEFMGKVVEYINRVI